MYTFFRKRFTLQRELVALLGIALLWIGAVLGYNIFLPFFGIALSYNTEPLLSVAYYLAWIAAALIFFPHTLKKIRISPSRDTYALLIVFVGVLALFYEVLIPLFGSPVMHASQEHISFLIVTSNYFLPKLADIAFQQILIAALVLTLASYRDDVRFVSVAYGALFMIAHLFLLPLMGLTYTLLFTVASLCSALIFPYLILRVQNGFVYSFGIHFLFYIFTTLWFWV